MAYLSFTVIYTTMGNRGNMSRQLIYVVTQLLSDSVMTFFFQGEAAVTHNKQSFVCNTTPPHFTIPPPCEGFDF